jgi:N-acyl-phosphatidylethanolamine-hydrolysing phospholipase D
MSLRLFRGLLKGSVTPRNIPNSAKKSAAAFWQTPHFSTTAKMSSVGGAGLGAGLYAVVSNPSQVLSQPEEAAAKAHHLKNGKGFTNPWESYTELTPFTMLWGLFMYVSPSSLLCISTNALRRRKITGQMNKPDTTPPTVPVRTPNFLPTRDTPKLRATWLGHACYYVEFPGGLRVLFDPVFEDCCAPINMKSLKRFTPPPCELEDLPAVDVVVISHNHYDHLSYPTIQRLQKRFPDAHYFAPLGNKAWFDKCGVENMTELDWWESRDVKLDTVKSDDSSARTGSVSITKSEAGGVAKGGIHATFGALPCQHVSARGPFDKCKTLWASWSVSSGGATVYFAGDTGYRTVPDLPKGTDDYAAEYAHLPVCPAFKHIGEHRGPFDLGLIPIGAYEPRWVFSNVHADPKDAVNIFVDTKCRRGLGMHWGTWVLTEEDVLEPPRKLKEALKWKGIEEGRFGVTEIGESVEVESR